MTFSLGFFSDNAVISAITSLALLGLWVAIGIAMVKHNLYDIDVILNKTIAYGALAVIITAVYVVVVVVIGAFIGVTEGLSLVATAVVAVAFQPIWRRAQHFANRLVYGERATPCEVLSASPSRSARRTRARTSTCGWCGCWPRGPERPPRPCEGRRRVPRRHLADERAAGAGASRRGQTPEFADATTSIPVKHRGEELGMLTVVKPPNEPLTPVERTLVTDLAGQAALLLYNSRLFEDLRASRQRLVAAQDEERRRLERNLHDGAQQRLALAVQARMAESLAGTDPNRQRELLRQVQKGSRTHSRISATSRAASPRCLQTRGSHRPSRRNRGRCRCM